MKNYSIEVESENIYIFKTKSYFKEVTSSFYNDNYRAAVVTLYSVVLADLLQKLSLLHDLYSDSIAENILKELKAIQEAKPTSSEWEKELIDQVFEKTQLMETSDYANLIALQKIRHLCAHPVIDKEDKLFTPNRESVRAFIRNMLEGFLCKPPLYTQKVFDEFITDISSKKEYFIESKDLERYIYSKYFNNLSLDLTLDIFKKLWKFTFKLNNTEAQDNREINYKCLNILFGRNFEQCQNFIRDHKSYFSNISPGEPSSNLIYFLSKRDHIFNYLEDKAKVIIETETKENIDSFTIAWFLTGDMSNHFDQIKQAIKDHRNDWQKPTPHLNFLERLFDIADNLGYQTLVSEFIIWYYTTAPSFNVADNIYRWFLSERIDNLTKTEVQTLLSGCEQNSQTYSRKAAKEDHLELKNLCEQKFKSDIDVTKYPNTFN